MGLATKVLNWIAVTLEVRVRTPLSLNQISNLVGYDHQSSFVHLQANPRIVWS